LNFFGVRIFDSSFLFIFFSTQKAQKLTSKVADWLLKNDLYGSGKNRSEAWWKIFGSYFFDFKAFNILSTKREDSNLVRNKKQCVKELKLY
jgi:hypothetical protein